MYPPYWVSSKEGTFQQRMNERVEHFIDGMMDW